MQVLKGNLEDNEVLEVAREVVAMCATEALAMVDHRGRGARVNADA
jgi:hypothetical protein